MTQDERWLHMWNAYMSYLKRNKRCPSKYVKRDMRLVNWAKHNRKLRNKGLMQDSRKEKFQQLLDLSAKYRRTNQHAYASPETANNDAQ